MPNSKFATSVQQHSKPPWCKPGLFPIPPTYIAGNPIKIIAAAWWFNAFGSPAIAVAHSFDLDFRNATDDWFGQSALGGPRLRITITKVGPPGVYDVQLEGNTGSAWNYQNTWLNVLIDPLPAFAVRLLEVVTQPGLDYYGLSVIS